MDEPPRKLDYGDSNDRPAPWWDRLPRWAQILVQLSVIVPILILIAQCLLVMIAHARGR